MWILIGLLAVGYAMAVVRLGPRAEPGGPTGRHPPPGRCWSLGVFSHVARVRLADARRRRAVALQRPHGAAPASSRSSPRPCCCWATPAWLARWVLHPAVAVPDRPLAGALPPRGHPLQRGAGPLALARSRRPHAAQRAGPLRRPRDPLRELADRLAPDPESAAGDPRGSCRWRGWSSSSSSRSCPPSRRRSSRSARSPSYKAYEGLPHLWGATTLEDQRIAGLIMKLAAGLLIWAIIAVVFFRWASEEERADRSLEPAGMAGS